MDHDPVYNRLRETSWRRALTDAEQAELRAYLAIHPDAETDWEAEASLNTSLNRLPSAPVPSNFTARVLQAIELESVVAERERPNLITNIGGWWWRVFVPRTAVALIVVAAGWSGYRHYRTDRIAEGLAVVATVESPPNSLALEDFEAIRRLNPTLAADEELLKLKEELLALTQ